ncbi:MAG: DNA polymerase [Peptococcaceae bacterium BRH_c8a]|nr:MAG: DNA polymerase [Peptococcaceae bacterium BRH_c8a]
MGEKAREIVEIDGRVLTLSNLDKMMWPEENITKAHLIKYYLDLAPVLLPYIRNRPLVMKRYPDGIQGDFFYQKECPDYAPDWVETYSVKHTHKVINYIVCNDTPTLAWMAGQGCLEIHAWLSRVDEIDCPDLAVFDLDPAEGVSFSSVKQVALIVRGVLEQFEITGFPKTSGSSGMHVFIPLEADYSFTRVTEAMKYLAELILRAYPDLVTVERSKAKRKGKVYLDYLQNGWGKTMAFPYSLRPLSGAPVSTPLTWHEVEYKEFSHRFYNIQNIARRISQNGDPYSNIFQAPQSLDRLFNVLSPEQFDISAVDSARL